MEGDHTSQVARSCMSHFNPLPPHGGRQEEALARTAGCNISIHSLRMEGDRCCLVMELIHGNFNPLPPHGGRPKDQVLVTADAEFQSTPSAWRETIAPSVESLTMTDFNPLPPHGGRPPLPRSVRQVQPISIHSLRMEGDSRLRRIC